MAPQEACDGDEYFYYFAYGSNLLEERIHVQIKDAVFVNIGLLSGYRLEFYDHSQRWMGAVASVEKSETDEVWGCVWRVPWSFSNELDRQEDSYHRLNVGIRVGNSTVLCRTYQYSSPKRRQSLPSPHYKVVIICGAIEHLLPAEYIKKLKRIKDNGYVGPVELNLVALKNLNSDTL